MMNVYITYVLYIFWSFSNRMYLYVLVCLLYYYALLLSFHLYFSPSLYLTFAIHRTLFYLQRIRRWES